MKTLFLWADLNEYPQLEGMFHVDVNEEFAGCEPEGGGGKITIKKYPPLGIWSYEI